MVAKSPHAHQVARTTVLPMVERLRKALRKFTRKNLELTARFIETVELVIAERSSEALSEHSGDSGG